MKIPYSFSSTPSVMIMCNCYPLPNSTDETGAITRTNGYGWRGSKTSCLITNTIPMRQECTVSSMCSCGGKLIKVCGSITRNWTVRLDGRRRWSLTWPLCLVNPVLKQQQQDLLASKILQQQPPVQQQQQQQQQQQYAPVSSYPSNASR